METKVIRAYGYARVSTENQDLQRQRDLINECCISNNYSLIDIFEDEAVSGVKSKEERKGLSKLYELTNNDCDIVVISELSRLSRENEIMKVLVNVNELIEKGIGIIFIDNKDVIYKDNLELYDILSLSIGAEFAAKERIKTKERLISGLDSKYIDTPNLYRGAVVPLGFKVIDNPLYVPKRDKDNFVRLYAKKILRIDEINSKLVNEIFDFVISGKTSRDIAIILNNRNIRTVRNKRYTEGRIGEIIRNRMYIGENKRRDRIYNMGFQIVDTDKFYLANKLFKENTLFKYKGTKRFNPLKGIAKCTCGYGLTIINNSTDKRPDNLSISCIANKSIKQNDVVCNNYGIEANRFFDSIWKTVELRLISIEYHIQRNENINILKKEISRLKNDIVTFNRNIKDLTSEKTNLINKLEHIDYIPLIKDYQERIRENDVFINDYKIKIDNSKENITKIENEIKYLGKKTQFYDNINDKEKQRIYRAELKQIIYYSVTRYKGFIHILYKNGNENIIAIKKHIHPFSILLPNHYKFNPEKKCVFHTVNIMNKNDFYIGQSEVKTLYFDDIMKNRYEYEQDGNLLINVT